MARFDYREAVRAVIRDYLGMDTLTLLFFWLVFAVKLYQIFEIELFHLDKIFSDNNLYSIFL